MAQQAKGRWAVHAGKRGALASRACGRISAGAQRRQLVFKRKDNPPPRRRLLSHALLPLPRPPDTLCPPPLQSPNRAHALRPVTRGHSPQVSDAPPCSQQVRSAPPTAPPAGPACEPAAVCRSPHLQSRAKPSCILPTTTPFSAQPSSPKSRRPSTRGGAAGVAAARAQLSQRRARPPGAARAAPPAPRPAREEAGLSANRRPPVWPIAAGAAPRPAPRRKRTPGAWRLPGSVANKAARPGGPALFRSPRRRRLHSARAHFKVWRGLRGGRDRGG